MENEYDKYKELPYFRTDVDISKTQNEIKKLLRKHGLEAIRFTEWYDKGVIEFILRQNGKPLAFRFSFNIPQELRYQRQVYRALGAYLKARFTSVDFGINTVAQEFMSELILKLPDGSTGTVREVFANNITQLEFSKDLLLPLGSE